MPKRIGFGVGVTIGDSPKGHFTPSLISGLSVWYDPSDPDARVIDGTPRYVYLRNKADTNINADPLFVGAGADNYHLQATSPCRGVGTDTPGVTVDLDGNPIPSLHGPHMGCYE